jgi:hypothetical protein
LLINVGGQRTQRLEAGGNIMQRKFFWVGMLLFGLIMTGCPIDSVEDVEEKKEDNTIFSVSITGTPKVGSELTATVKNNDSNIASGVQYQWKRGDSQYSTFVDISNATSSRYTLTIEDSGKYIKVEAKNSSTTSPVGSNVIGPVDANQVAKPTADPNGGNVVPGQEITISSTTENVIIYYTLDGTTPSTSSNLYYSSLKPKITSHCTLKAIATKSGMVDSEVLSVTFSVVTVSFSPVASSTDLFTRGIYSVAYGSNKFVAGGNARMAYSTNGTTWTDSSSTGIGLVKGITYGTQFVAVGYDYSGWVIHYSSDGGVSWSTVTTTTFGTSRINDVAYGGGRYVAVGNDGKAAYSTNGSSWTAVTTTQFGTDDINGITYGAGKFIAVGSGGKMAYSTNGSTWTMVSDSKFSTSTIYGITYGGPFGGEKFIAVGSGLGSFKIACSSDGITWTSVLQYGDGLFSSLNRVTWGGNMYCAVGSQGVMFFSLDGLYWSKIDGGTGAGKSQFDINIESSIYDIVYGGGKFIAVGSKYVSLGVGSGEMAIISN